MNIRWLPRVRTNSKWDVAPAGAYIVCDSCFEQLEEACLEVLVFLRTYLLNGRLHLAQELQPFHMATSKDL